MQGETEMQPKTKPAPPMHSVAVPSPDLPCSLRLILSLQQCALRPQMALSICPPHVQVADPGLDLSRSRVVEAMHHLLATDGF